MLPIYEARIDNENEGMFALSLLNNPATQVQFLAYEDEQEIQCSVVNEEERKILCVIMRADYPFFRKSSDGRDFYVVYHKDTLEIMAQKLLKDGKQSSINIQHTPTYVDGMEMEQIFIKNTEKGINPKGFEAIEEGSLFGVYKIENDELWEAIKGGTFTGVSLEGLFKLTPEREEKKEETISTLKQLFDYLNK